MARRKTFKKQAFNSLPNCFRSDAELKGKWSKHFGNDNPIVLEIGCGKADLSAGLARKYPDRNYIGIDLKADRMWYAARDAIADGVPNMAFICLHLLTLTDHFEENEIDEIWITFPDPFPKKKQAKHRMINPNFLTLYQKILSPEGKIHYKTDNLSLFQFSLEVFVRVGNISIESLSFDLHESEEISEDAKIETHYERQFRAMGTKINYTRIAFKPS